MRKFAITVGDPSGIGPEITLKAICEKPEIQKRAVLFSNLSILKYYNEKFKYNFIFNEIDDMSEFDESKVNVYDSLKVNLEDIKIGHVSKISGEIAFMAIVEAIRFVKQGDLSLVVTAPLNKESLHLAGHNFAGHTEIFNHYCNGKSYAMLLWSDKLKVIHVTTHVSLRKACDLCKKDRIVQVVNLVNDTLKKVGYKNPIIAVSGLNPHAGENGLFGDEEINEISPAVLECQQNGINCVGPIPPDTVFLRAFKGQYDVVVAMYHDQGHIPLKMLDFNKGVNITVGLDVIRTSVDHGTAFDIAGKNIASCESILEAIKIAELL